MKVLTERDKFLSDYEVLQHVQLLNKEIQSYQTEKKKKGHPGGLDLETITNDTINYLNQRPCNSMNEQGITSLLTHLNTLDLYKVEKLQIVNSLPRSMVHLHALVEECDSRFDSESCNNILEKIEELFPNPQEDDPEDEQEN